MGVCGSTRKKEDEVWTRGSFSVKSVSKDEDQPSEDVMDSEAERKKFQAGAGRKRLTLPGNLVGQIDLTKPKGEFQESRENFEETVPSKAVDVLNDISDCHYVALSKKGFIPYDEKVNQDAVLCIERVPHNIPGLDMHFFAALDGHGHFGRDVSQTILQTFPVELEKKLAPFTELEELTDEVVCTLLRDCIDNVHTSLLKTRIPLQHSGTTFCGSLIFDNTIYTLNVGDSQSMMVTRNPNEDYIIHDLNVLHSPDKPLERKRIEENNGVVHKLPGIPSEEAGPYRVWLPDMSGPGLAMSRSLGDTVAHSVGVSHEPTFNIQRIDETCKYVLWASDGVFEFLLTSHVAEVLMTDDTLQEKAKKIVKKAVKLWRRYDSVVDDISVIILQLPGSNQI